MPADISSETPVIQSILAQIVGHDSRTGLGVTPNLSVVSFATTVANIGSSSPVISRFVVESYEIPKNPVPTTVTDPKYILASLKRPEAVET